jgi:protein-tyrosine-phosphatase
MAAAFFNQMAKGRARAISAGSQPADDVNPVVVEAMREVGIDISKNKPKLLTFEMMEGIEKAITMGCEETCPVTTVETEDWGLEDPKDRSIEEVRIIRDVIKRRVENLLKEMVNE